MEIEVLGHKVVLREEFKAKETWPIYAYVRDLLSAEGQETYEGDVEVLSRIIESWDLPDDPKDPESYATLDFPFFYELMREMGGYLAERMFPSKNSVEPPTSD